MSDSLLGALTAATIGLAVLDIVIVASGIVAIAISWAKEMIKEKRKNS